MAITDNFNRSNGLLGSGWGAARATASAVIVSNAVQMNSNFAVCVMRRTEYKFPDDQYAQAECSFTTGANEAWTGVGCRIDTYGRGYFVTIGLNTLTLRRNDGTSTYTFVDSATVTAAASTMYTVKIEATGTTIKVYFEGAEVISVTDATYSSGNPAIIFDGNTDRANLDDFECSDATTATPSHPWAVMSSLPASGTGAVTPNVPDDVVANDIMLLFVESANQTIALTTANGFAEVADSPQGTGTAGGTTSTRLAIFWKRAAGGDSDPVITDPGDHCIAQILVVRGCITSGNPWDVTTGDTGASSTSVSIPGDTTTVANCLVIAAVANATDSATLQTSGWANGDLTDLREVLDHNTATPGNGGGFGVAQGVKAAAGSYAATTATLASASVQGRISIALKPPAVAGRFAGGDFFFPMVGQ